MMNHNQLNTFSQISTFNVLVINPANQINSVKFTDENYLMWNLQVLVGIRSLGLEVFILPQPPVPSPTISEDGGSEVVNPTFISTWCRQDRLLFSFLLASMAEGVQGQMIGCETSSQLWNRVSRLFATRTKARVMQYKLQLQTQKKGSLSMKDYLEKMKGYVGILSACGHLITEGDQIIYVLGGIGLEYDYVVVHVTSQVDTLTLSDVGALLLAHEGRIEAFHTTENTLTPTVNKATLLQPQKSEYQSQQLGSSSRGRRRGRNNRGGRRAWNNNNGRHVCQICGISVHIAEKCYYRFDPDFVPQQKQNGPRYHNGQYYQQQGPFKPTPQRPVAVIATTNQDSTGDDWWYLDSGASHHITNEFGNLSLGSEYSGNGKSSYG